MQFRITIDSTAIRTQLAELGQERQGPFILSKTLNTLAKAVQKDLRQNIMDSLKVRRVQFIKNAVKIDKGSWSTKTRLKVTIFIDSVADFLADFETGAEHLPYNGHTWLTIPNKKVFGKSVIGREHELRPKNLHLEHTARGIQGLQRTFLVDDKNTGTPLILQRTSPEDKGKRRRGTNKKTGVRILYTLVKSAKRPKRIQWYNTANESVINNQEGIWTEVIKQALADTKK